MREFSDEQLVTMTLNGDSVAFGQLVERYQKQVFSLAYRLGGDYDEAQDMAQEAFLRIYQELPKFDLSRRFFPWMYRVAHNVCVNLLARRPKDVTPLENVLEFQEDTAQVSDPEAGYEQQELQGAIGRALLELPEQYRLPLMLKYIEGFSYQQICAHLDLPLTTVETRLFRGRKLLRDKLAGKL